MHYNLEDKTLVKLIQRRLEENPDRVVFRYRHDDGSHWCDVTYRLLDQHARRIAFRLKKDYQKGDRAVLLYAHNPEFFYAFLGCIYAGLIPVPGNPPTKHRHFTRLMSIVKDSGAKLILTEDLIYGFIGGSYEDADITFISTEQIEEERRDVSVENPMPDDIAFLQYTSGSTGQPKGVMVSHYNMVYNVWCICEAAAIRKEAVKVDWLPSFHDMGLIAGYILAIMGNFETTFLSPVAFLKNPLVWIKVINEMRGNYTSVPNFALGMVAEKIEDAQLEGMDFSCFDQIYCGGEPVRKKTVDHFQDKLGPFGLKDTAVYPCYGMAETVLMITVKGRNEENMTICVDKNLLTRGRVKLSQKTKDASSWLYSCGRTWGDTRIEIINPQTMNPCGLDEIGEIWLKGSIVTKGYWEKPEANAVVFNGTISSSGENGFLRTGDMGIVLDGHLYVTGRLKDMLIVRGRNFYPEDIEHSLEGCHKALRLNNCAAFSVDGENRENVILVQEVYEEIIQQVDAEEVVDAMRKRITESYNIETDAICLISSRKLPKTTSGKIQRQECKRMYLASEFNVLHVWNRPVENVTWGKVPMDAGAPEGGDDIDDLKSWLRTLIAEKAQIHNSDIEGNSRFSDLGVDSVKTVEITDQIERKLGFALPPNFFWEYPTLDEAVAFLEDEQKFYE